ncbi:hypothetical protein BMF94_4499 [Rhodotorula taiwanensis]|uniref:BZIP domain-containing protein n=1 Tax=Rhodotorula taiwanensis TaxID=741276 RepID=A0A2S5B7C0_9BASI|nr:hypothetical protein BMF94_4499 [Rhodotorula taiwanensis]
MHNALFEQLAPSPGTTPANGPAVDRSDVALSFPCDSNALQAQLEAWTNVAFDFDSPASDDVPLSSATSPRAADKHLHDAFSANRTHDFAGFSSTVAPGLFADAPSSAVDLTAFLGNSSVSNSATTSLVDPALSLPSFAQSGLALPDAFFVAPGVTGLTGQDEPATLSPADMSTASVETAAAPSPARTSRAAGKKVASGPARKKRASSSAASATPVAVAVAVAPAAPVASTSSAAASTSSEASTPAAGKAIALPLPEGIDTKGLNDEELNRLAIEEDKRRRNTAASARFRVKKKQREQALEEEAKKLRERVAVLEKEVDTLKTENGWLRGLITDKHIDVGMSGADNNRKRRRVDGEPTVLDPSALLV